MFALGYSLNTLTLLAWVLAIGLVVDDAIYVLENVYRHIEAGLSPLQAALVGTREISFAVIAMTLTLAAVYTPIGFLSSMTGVLFREFAFTLAGAVIVSGIIALTLSPMMCAQLLRPIKKHSLSQQMDQLFLKILKKYQTMLRHVLCHPKKVVLVSALLYLCAGLFFHLLPSELAPDEDQGLIKTAINIPTGSNLHYIEQYTAYLNKIYERVPERANYGINNNPNGSDSFLALKPWNERNRSSQEIIEALAPQMEQIPGIEVFPVNPPALPGSSGSTKVSIVLKSTGSWEALEQAANQLKALAKNNPKLKNITSNMQSDQPIINFDIDRNKASSLGINMSDLSNSLNTLLGEPIFGYFAKQGEVYPIIPQVYPEEARNPSQLAQIPIRVSNGQTVPLGSFTQFNQIARAELLPHFQKLRSITIRANLAPGYTLGQALTYLTTQVDQHLPREIEIDYSGASRTFIDSQSSMGQLFLFSMLFIFLVLAAQFESFRDPLIIMIAVPLSLFGALLTMLLTHCTLNIYTEIGLVTLIGLMSKHSILMVEFANQILASGKGLKEAAFESASIRFRPILMTTMAMVLGALPLVFAHGAGSAARQQLGWVIAGGMGIGTLCTLFIIPTAYLLMANRETNDYR
jgi:multidrug efflux pump